MTISVPFWEQQLFWWVHSHPKALWFRHIIHETSSTVFLLSACCLLLGILTWRQRLLALILLGITDSFCFRILKPFLGRMRPCHSWPEVFLVQEHCGSLMGLPSNHAANSAAVISFIVSYKKFPFLWIFPIFIGWSRVYLGVHFPLDVFLGWGIGYSLAKLIFYIERRWLCSQNHSNTSTS